MGAGDRDPVSDVVIVGAGVVGLATAYELAKRGVRATVVERRGVAAGQSGRNWGFVRQQGRSPAELPLMVAANRRWQSLSDELGASIGWRQGGNLALAESVVAARRYHHWLAVGRDHGVGSVLVDEDAVQRIVPGLRQPFRAALYAAADGSADPVATTEAYARTAERLGVRLVVGRRVRALASSSRQVTGVVTDEGVIPAGQVVCAAGAWTRRVLRTVGVGMPQSPVRATVCMTKPLPPITESTVWAPRFAFRQRPDGRVVLSDGSEGDVDLTADMVRQARLFLPAFRHNWRQFRLHLGRAVVEDPLANGREERAYEPTPSAARVARSIRRFTAVLPWLRDVAVEKSWAGLIDSTPDALPVLGRVAGQEGLIVASGFSGHGFGLGPIVGEIVADLVQDLEPRFDLHPFRLSRFREEPVHAPEAIL